MQECKTNAKDMPSSKTLHHERGKRRERASCVPPKERRQKESSRLEGRRLEIPQAGARQGEAGSLKRLEILQAGARQGEAGSFKGFGTVSLKLVSR